MMKKKDDLIEERLRAWTVPRLEPDPALGKRVTRRIRQLAYTPATHSTHRFRLVAYGALAALLLVGVFFVSRQLERQRILRDGTYCLLIDPVFRAQALGAQGRLPAAEDTSLDRLTWMQDRLDLTRQQFMELVDLHRNYRERFDALYLELVELEKAYGKFEELRKRNEAIDFMALYDVLQERRSTVEASHSLSREFIGRVMVMLNPRQRQAYLSLVQPVNERPHG